MLTTIMILMLVLSPLAASAEQVSPLRHAPTDACIVVLENQTNNALSGFKVRFIVKGEADIDIMRNTWELSFKPFGFQIPGLDDTTFTFRFGEFPCCKHIHLTLFYDDEQLLERDAIAENGHCLLQKIWWIRRKESIPRESFQKTFALPDVIDLVDDSSNRR